MMKLITRTVLLGSLVIGIAPSWAADRDSIAAERAQVQSRFDATKRECETRFVVSSCVEAAEVQRRDAMARLREQEVALDQAERKLRAQQRHDEIRAKTEAAAQAPVPVPRAPREAASAAPVPSPEPEPKFRPREPAAATSRSTSEAQRAANKAKFDRRQPSAPTQQLSEAERAANRERFEQRQKEAQAHRDEVLQRNREQDKTRTKPQRPLPDPATP